MLSQLCAIRKNIYSNNEIVQEISFMEDIDSIKSDIYYLDSKDDFLEFGVRVIEEIGFQHYINIIGKSEFTDNQIKFILDPVNDIDTMKHLNVLLDKNIDMRKVDAICVKFGEIKTNYFGICIINKSFRDILRKLYDHVLPADANVFAEGNTKRLKIDINSNKNVHINSFYNNKVLDGYSTALAIKEKVDELIIDMKNPILLINGKKHHMSIPYKFYEDQMFVDITACVDKRNDIDEDVIIKSVSLCKNEGYVYFKPIEIKADKVKVYALYKGCVGFEYYCNKREAWITLNESSVLREKLLLIRVSMSMQDRVYSIIFIRA